MGWALSCQELIGTGAGAGRHGHEQATERRAEADLLALHVAQPAWSTAAGNSGLPAYSTCIATDGADDRTIAIAAKIVQPWRWSPAYRPKV